MSKGHMTGMAGEFAVMEKLFRLGHQPSLTLSYKRLSRSHASTIWLSIRGIGGSHELFVLRSYLRPSSVGFHKLMHRRQWLVSVRDTALSRARTNAALIWVKYIMLKKGNSL